MHTFGMNIKQPNIQLASKTIFQQGNGERKFQILYSHCFPSLNNFITIVKVHESKDS